MKKILYYNPNEHYMWIHFLKSKKDPFFDGRYMFSAPDSLIDEVMCGPISSGVASGIYKNHGFPIIYKR
jgi:hypothetical protein